MVRELAPQSKSGAYVRPKYTFDGRIGDTSFPVRMLLQRRPMQQLPGRVAATVMIRTVAGYSHVPIACQCRCRMSDAACVIAR